MNIIFMGTPDLAATILDKLIDSAHNILAVVTQPDRPKGRGKKLKVNPVKQIALDTKVNIRFTKAWLYQCSYISFA